jgi:hypothetical protein
VDPREGGAMSYYKPDIDKAFSGSLMRGWIIVRNLALMGIILLLFEFAKTIFEVLTVSLLILLLLHQWQFEKVFSLAAYQQNIYIMKMFHRLSQDIRADDLQPEIARGEEILSFQETNQVIDIGFYYLCVAIVVWKIISIM